MFVVPVVSVGDPTYCGHVIHNLIDGHGHAEATHENIQSREISIQSRIASTCQSH